MAEILPVVHFTHADVNENECLDAKFEIVKVNESPSGTSDKLTDKKSKKRIKMTLKEEDMSYEAVEEDMLPYLLVVHDKADDSLSLHNLPYFMVKPECFISNYCLSNERLKVDKAATYSEKMDSLTAAFGSSKKRKAMQTKIKNRIDTDTLEKAVNTAVEDSKAVIESFSTPQQDGEESMGINQDSLEQYSILPVPNKNAESPSDVYDLHETLSISKEELDKFTEELATKFSIATDEAVKKWKETALYPEYVLEELTILEATTRPHKYKMRKAKLLAYLNYLLALYRLKSAQLRTKSPLSSSEVPHVAINRLFDMYTVCSSTNAQAKSMRTMPRRLKDKLTCHILILALHINDFTTNLQSLQKDLKLPLQKLSDYFQALGCYVRSQVSTVKGKKLVCKIAQLKLPLNEAAKQDQKKRARKS